MTTRVVKAVAEEKKTDPMELPPLYEAVGDTLAALEDLEAGELTFEYVGLTVTAYSSGAVEVTDSPSVSPDKSDKDPSAAGD